MDNYSNLPQPLFIPNLSPLSALPMHLSPKVQHSVLLQCRAQSPELVGPRAVSSGDVDTHPVGTKLSPPTFITFCNLLQAKIRSQIAKADSTGMYPARCHLAQHFQN
ncbi:hypothetical protein KIL84_015729 [Mauremys mutica]|uniref:Uncharacterized protein n=1 Tax=Mauremys mutica TaxID=74926 RepID=A0A9D4AMA2_9SAUR|nr:hypothetical protein KIL84_015729 [Mauremys mutica]